MIPPLPSLTTNLAHYLTMKTQINQDLEVKTIKQTLVQVNQKKPKRSKKKTPSFLAFDKKYKLISYKGHFKMMLW